MSHKKSGLARISSVTSCHTCLDGVATYLNWRTDMGRLLGGFVLLFQLVLVAGARGEKNLQSAVDYLRGVDE